MTSQTKLNMGCGKLFALALVAVVANQAALAQSGFSFGSGQDDAIDAITEDTNGNIYIGGFQNGNIGVENYWPVGNSVGFVEKRSPAGFLLWRHEFDTPEMDSVEALSIDSSGHVLVAGRTMGSFSQTPNAGQLDTFVAVLDSAAGAQVAITQFGDERPQHPVAIIPLTSGKVVVAGYDDVFVQGNAVMDWENGWLARLDFNGTNIALNSWTKSTLPSSDLITAASGVKDGTDDIVYAYSGTKWGIRLIRVNPAGATVWDHVLSGSTIDYVAGIVASPTNDFYVAGTTILPLAGPALGNSDSFVIKIDPTDGSMVWSVQLGSAGAEWTSGLALDSAGNILVAGDTDGEVQPGHVVQAGTYDPFVITVSTSGQLMKVWQGYEPAFYWNPHLIASSTCPDAPWLTGMISGPGLPILPTYGGLDAMANAVPVTLIEGIFQSSFEVACSP